MANLRRSPSDRPAWAWIEGNTAFTPLITLWYLIFQRLSPNHHLSQVVEDALEGGADRLSPHGKPLSQRLRSEATTSFSDARIVVERSTAGMRSIAGEIAACNSGSNA